MYSFLRRPAWIALHLIVLAITIAFVSLGRWQLSRLEDRRVENVQVAERLAGAPTDWPVDTGGTPTEYSRIRLTGILEPAEEVLLRSQVSMGQPGYDLLTPLYLENGSVVVVNRGWVPLELDAPPIMQALPPEGPVSIEGFVRYPLAGSDSEVPGADEEPLVIDSRVDLDRLDRQIQGEVEPFYVELTSIEPPAGSLPIPSDVPEITEGSHFSYAVQWFSFAAVSIVGYAALIRSTARRRGGLRRRAAPGRPDSS